MAEADEGTCPFETFVVERSGRHHVVLAHRDTPNWWRVIAIFNDGRRAQSYADIEIDCWEPKDGGTGYNNDAGPAPTADLPADPEPRQFTALPTSLINELLAAVRAGPAWSFAAEPTPISRSPVATLPASEPVAVEAPAVAVFPGLATIENSRGPNHLPDDVHAVIVTRLRSGDSMREIRKDLGVASGTILSRRDALVRLGELLPRSEMPHSALTMKPDRRSTANLVSPEETERRVQAVLAAIRALSAEGGKVSYSTIMQRARVKSVSTEIAALKLRGIIETSPNDGINTRLGGVRLVVAPTGTVERQSAAKAPAPAEEPAAAEPDDPDATETLSAGEKLLAEKCTVVLDAIIMMRSQPKPNLYPTNAEISGETSLPLSAIPMLLDTLVRGGYLEKDGLGRLRPVLERVEADDG